MGSRLKSPRLILIMTRIWMSPVTETRVGESKEIITARIRLLKGPAKAVRAMSLGGFSKLWGLTGTGLPQPNPVRNKNIVPKGSRWASGLMVTRPAFFGVSSPS